MSESDENLEQLSRPLLERYVETRRKIDAEAQTIESLAHVLSRFKCCHRDSVEIDPFALACIHEVIERSILDLREMLDAFISIGAAQQRLGEKSHTATKVRSNHICCSRVRTRSHMP